MALQKFYHVIKGIENSNTTYTLCFLTRKQGIVPEARKGMRADFLALPA